MRSMIRPMALAGLALFAAGAVQAHMPYVLPSIFDVGKRGHVLVQASFTEDAFVPDIAMQDAPFHLIAPDGTPGPVGPVSYLRDVSIFEADLKAEGTYRLTSGQRLGRKGKMFKVGDQWKMRGEGGEPPAGATLVEVQSTTLAEAYVTRGKPSDAALKPYGAALEVEALTHPNGLSVNADAPFRVLFDGRPMAGLSVTVFRSAGVHDGRKVAAQVTTDAAGRFTFRPDAAGTFLLLVRHRAASPAGAETPFRSYTYTLAFDAV